MQMMQDARDGLISRIVVKKYDRFSRNMREYLNITDELDRYGVTVYSLSEPFNTETKEGRMMQAKARKRRTVDTAPLEKPMKHWDKLSIPEKHELAAVMLEAVYVSDENGIEVKFSI